MSDPIRVLALAVLRQAMLDYRGKVGRRRKDAERFLRGEGRKLWNALGLDEEFLDDFLECPQKVRYLLLNRQLRK